MNQLFAAAPLPSRLADLAWLLFRLHVGLSIALGAGWSKLMQLYTSTEAAKLAGGAATLGPPDWFVQQVANLGFTFPSPYMWAWLACWGEFAGGLLIALGLLTRFSALQLAVRFFVVAFLWYEGAEPIVGMYYQQLLFWAFVLVTVVGAGRYSLDYAISQRGPLLPRLRQLLPGRRVPVAAGVVFMLASATACWANLHSDLLIRPGKQFALGGEQRGAFKVVARNVGQVAVEFKERPAGGGIFGKGTLKPGQRATLRFAAGSTALLLNPSANTANLKLVVSGDTNLRMGYEVNGTR